MNDDEGEFSLQDWVVDENGVLLGPKSGGHYYSVRHLTIPSFVTGIAGGCFRGCDNLSAVDIPDSVKWIGEKAFAKLEHLHSITIPGSVETIHDQAFVYCNHLEEVTILNGVKTIGRFVFDNCYGYFKIAIPASVTSLSALSIRPRFGLHIGDITIDEGNTSYKIIDGNIYSYDNKTLVAAYVSDNNYNVKIPQGVTEIGSMAFCDFKNLRSVEIPDSVVKIGNGAFEHTDLVTVDIPASVTSMGCCVFKDCNNLVSIDIPASITSIDYDVFEDCNNLKKIVFEDPTNWASQKKYKEDKYIPVKDKILRDPVKARDFLVSSYKKHPKGSYGMVKLTGKSSSDAGL